MSDRAGQIGEALGASVSVRLGWPLLRCCVDTARSVGNGREGETVECERCTGRLVWHDGAWEWGGPPG